MDRLAPILDHLEAPPRSSPEAKIVVVEEARDGCLCALVRSLLPGHPQLGVHGDPQCIEQAPEGSVQILRATSACSAWLPQCQATVQRRHLQLVFWLTERSKTLIGDALDELVASRSLRVVCPQRVASHGEAGLLAGAHGPGVEWLGGPLHETLQAAYPDQPLVEISADQSYAGLVERIREAGDAWLCWTEIDGAFRLRRVRWALAEAGRWGRSVLVEPRITSPGWWPVHARFVAFEEAIERLAAVGASHPGRLLALCGMEPEALELLEALLEMDETQSQLEALLLQADDPGAELARRAEQRGLFSVEDVVAQLVAPPIQRAFGTLEQTQQLRQQAFDRVADQLAETGSLPAELLGSWAASTEDEVPVEMLNWSTGPVSGWLTEALLRSGPADAEAWRAVAAAALRLGDPRVAALWAERALAHCDEDEITLSRVLFTCARADYRQGEFASAERRLRECLALQERLLGAEHSEIARTLHALGQALSKQRRYTHALSCYTRALNIEQQHLDGGHADIAVTLHALGQVMVHLNRCDEATKAFDQALSIKERTLGRDHPSTAATLYAIGKSLTRQGEYKKALRAFQRDLRITRRALGRDHPSLGTSMHAVGQTYTLMGRREEALACFHREVTIVERALGPDHPDLTSARDAKGQALATLGRFTEAIEQLKLSLATKEAHLGPDRPEVADTLFALGQVYADMGDLRTALSTFERALDIRRNAQGPDHPYTALALHAIGQILTRTGEPERALLSFQRALDIKERALGPEHPETAITRFEYGRALRDAGDPTGVAQMMAAAGILERELGAGHAMVAAARAALR